MNKMTALVREMFTPGTALCAVTYAAIGVAIAALWLTIGFWRLLFLAAFATAGAFLGGVRDKKNTVRGIINRRFPSKDEPLVDTYEDLKNNKPE